MIHNSEAYGLLVGSPGSTVCNFVVVGDDSDFDGPLGAKRCP